MRCNFGRSLGQGGAGHAPFAGHLLALPGSCARCTPSQAAVTVGAGLWRLRTLGSPPAHRRVAIVDSMGHTPIASVRAACAAVGLPLADGLLLRASGPADAERLLCAAVATRVAPVMLVLDASDLVLRRRAAGRGAPDAVRLVRRGHLVVLGMCCPLHHSADVAADGHFRAWAVGLTEKPFFCGSLGSSVAP